MGGNTVSFEFARSGTDQAYNYRATVPGSDLELGSADFVTDTSTALTAGYRHQFLKALEGGIFGTVSRTQGLLTVPHTDTVVGWTIADQRQSLQETDLGLEVNADLFGVLEFFKINTFTDFPVRPLVGIRPRVGFEKTGKSTGGAWSHHPDGTMFVGGFDYDFAQEEVKAADGSSSMASQSRRMRGSLDLQAGARVYAGERFSFDALARYGAALFYVDNPFSDQEATFVSQSASATGADDVIKRYSNFTLDKGWGNRDYWQFALRGNVHF